MWEENKWLKISCPGCRTLYRFLFSYLLYLLELNYIFSIVYERPFGLVYNIFMCQSEQVVGMQEGLGTIRILRKHVWGAFLTIYPSTDPSIL